MKYIDELDLSNKKVILRCDYNVPIKDGVIIDTTRIKKSLKTIEYLLERNCSIIILSHLGRVKTRDDKKSNSLEPISVELSNLLHRDVKFTNNPVGVEVIKACSVLQPGEVIMLENTRFCDFPERLESGNDLNLAEYWSKLGDIFVVDAFGSLHRSHASVAGISKYLPTCYGFLVKEEIENLQPVVNNIVHPFGVFMGGAKVDDKLSYIKNLLPKCDYLLLGGGIANSFLYALGYDIGESIATTDELTVKQLKELVSEYKEKIILPIDFVIDGNTIYDLNTKSINKYLNYFKKCKTIFINGTCGKFEQKPYERGSVLLYEGLKNIDAIKIAGGGDTLSCINQNNLESAFNYLSSGGGASLEYVSSGELEAIKFIENSQM